MVYLGGGSTRAADDGGPAHHERIGVGECAEDGRVGDAAFGEGESEEGRAVREAGE